MEAVLLREKLDKPVNMANSKATSSLENRDMLMMGPCLDYINQILMEEVCDDAACLQVDDARYQAIFSGFFNIVGQHLLPNACFDSTGNGDNAFGHEKGPTEMPLPGKNLEASEISLPGNGQYSFQQEIVEVGFNPKLDSGFMASHTPLMSARVAALPAMINPVQDLHDLDDLNEGSVSSLSSDQDTAVQNPHTAINLNDGDVLTDVIISCWDQDDVVKGPSGHRCLWRQEKGSDNFDLPLVDDGFSLKLAEIDLSFEDLKLNDLYVDLYVREPASSTGAAKERKHHGDKERFLAGKGNKTGENSTSDICAFVDVNDVLVSCARAVARGDTRYAEEILQELYQVHGASPNGTCLQRVTHFFSMALAARMRGTGGHLFKVVSHKMPSATTLLKATKVGFERIPFVKVCHYVANQSILKAAEGAWRLHIVDYGLSYGIQWPCLISALADRNGGPPSLVITGIEFPHPGVNPAKRLEVSGRRLAAYAKTHNVPFQYHAIVSNKPEDLEAASLNLHKGEVLVLNCIKCFRHLADESVDLALTIPPRQKLLNFMHSLNPHLLLTAVANAAYNSPFFYSRFREALFHFSNVFDVLDTLWGDTPQRMLMERSLFYREILNILCCEGTERVDRPENYKQWHARIAKTGFEQLPIPPTILTRSRLHVKQHYHKDFFIHDDAGGWMLMGWKGRIALAMSAWKPSLVNC